MNDEQLLRYSRHILLDEMGVEGQERIDAAHALVIGAGGLGSPVALYLGSAGVGRITLVDDDCVDMTNLQRQIAHTTDSVGSAQGDIGAAAIGAINPHVQVQTVCLRADAALLDQLVPQPTWCSIAATTLPPAI
jgi:molybdopterin/thiamine biosynthesis adenylyltransferase